tara:strand:- start:8516 stop:9358 length:843 start_codon:yes stop_codon:yes gene_type:complete
MSVAMFCFASMDGMLRHITTELHPFQTVFLRSIFGLFFLSPWLLRTGLEGLKTQRPLLHVARGFSSVFGFTLWVVALSLIPLAEATALSFSMPIFATLGGVLILREKATWARWIAVIVGFIGVLVIIRPGIAIVHIGALVTLLAACGFAASALITRKLSATEAPFTVVFFVSLFMSVVTLAMSLPVWQSPSFEILGVAAASGALGTIAQLCLVRAYGAADVSVIVPFDFVRLIFVTIIGFLVFAQIPDTWTWIGAILIVGGNTIAAHREGRAERVPGRAL